MDILITPHIPPDIALAKLVIEKLYRAAGAAAVYRPFRLGGTPHPLHARRFFSAYATADLVVGMRGHAVICGVGLRRPVVALSTHPKITPFMENCGLGAWSVDTSIHLAAKLTERSEVLLGDGVNKYFADRDNATGDFSQRLDQFFLQALQRVVK